ncbi:30S ribosomal protein S6 [candidate division KSB1 bacterium]|nr:30S ribosomal protein S6 [candidate division KSB1 bacterium]
MRKYETIFIIDSLLKSEEIDNIINKYERFLSANGGQIETIERWGKKRLAYEIKKRQYGYYVAIHFDGPPTMIKALEREYRLNESLLRFKTLAMPKRAAQAVVTKAPINAQKAQAPVEDKATANEPATAPAVEEDTASEQQIESEAVEATAEKEVEEATPEAAADQESVDKNE